MLSIDELTQADVLKLFALADQIRECPDRYINALKGRVIATLFYEPSTRTRSSFAAAMQKLGGGVVNLTPEECSEKKGESFSDTVTMMASYADALVIRHWKENFYNELKCPVPIINAGDGANEHPTQALLDFYTIWRRFKDGCSILFTGDVFFSRTVNSLDKLRLLFPGYHTTYSTPSLDTSKPIWRRGMTYIFDREIQLGRYDVLYMTRHQVERDGERPQSHFVMNYKKAEQMQQKAIIMHPLPRNSELQPDTDDNPRAVYLTEQVQNGLWIRMALLLQTLNQGKI